MEDKRLKRVFDQVKLSPEREEAMLADLLNEKKEVSGMKQTNSRHRIPAAATAGYWSGPRAQSPSSGSWWKQKPPGRRTSAPDGWRIW